MKKIIFVLLAAVCLSGCGAIGPRVNTVPHNQAPVITPGENEAIVYLIRPWFSFGAGRNVQIYEDGLPIGALTNNSYIIHRTGEGMHAYHEDNIAVQTEMSLEAGKTYYLVGRFQDIGMGNSLIFSSVPEASAKRILPEMQYVTPQ